MPGSDVFLPLDGGESVAQEAEFTLPDAEAVRDFCERAVAEASQERTQADFRKGLDACTERLKGILRLIRERTERIPAPRGFFVGDAERRSAYAESCRLLLLLDPEITALRAEITALCAIERRIADAENRQDLSRRMLLLWRGEHEKKKSKEPFLTLIKEAQAELDRQRECDRTMLREIGLLREEMFSWISNLYPTFRERLYRLSDMEHEGDSCDVLATRRLCTELADAVSARLRILEQREQTSK